MEEFNSSLQYCKSMAGMFQTVLSGCRLLHPSIEDFLEKTKKLELQLQSTIFTFSAFNESLKGLTEKTIHCKTGSSSDIKQWIVMVTDQLNLTKYFLIELTRILTVGSLDMRKKNEESKKKIKILEKTHLKEYKTIKSNIRRKMELADKMKKRRQRECSTDRTDGRDEKNEELRIKCKLFENQEKQAVRRACLEERAIFCSLGSFIKQLMSKQSDIFKSINSFDDSLGFIGERIEQVHDIPDISLSPDHPCEFDTPATSVTGGSLRGSRCGSFSSLGPSRPHSPLCIVEQADLAKGSAGPRKRKSQMTSYSSAQDTLNEGIISSYGPPFCAQVGNNDQSADIYDIALQISTDQQDIRSRGGSVSPGRDSREEKRTVFSTIRRTRSPYRKVELPLPSPHTTARRPPIPRKMQAESKMQAYFFPSKQQEERCEGYGRMTRGSSSGSVQSGYDSPSLAIVTSGATKVMSDVCKSDRRSRNLWSESILPDLSWTRRPSLGRSVSMKDQDNKCRYNLSESLLQTLDTLSLEHQHVQGR